MPRARPDTPHTQSSQKPEEGGPRSQNQQGVASPPTYPLSHRHLNLRTWQAFLPDIEALE